MIEEIDIQIRAALKSVIQAQVSPDALVYDFWVLGYEAQDWLGIVRKSNGRAHGYIITRREAGQLSDGAATDESWRYTIIGLYSYFHSNTERSEDQFSVEQDKILMALRPEKILTLQSGDEMRFGESTMSADLFPFGPEKAHYILINIEINFSVC